MKLELASTSRAQDAGYLAMVDLAAVAGRFGDRYRVVGGHMVSVLVAVSGATGVPARETVDADLGVPFEVVGDPRLLDGFAERGYVTSGASNRFQRSVADLAVVVDVLAPSYTGRLEANQLHGRLAVDEIPGLAYALARPGRRVALRVRLTDDAALETTVLVPDIVAALCIKTLAYRSRYAGRDALDVWRLLEAGYAEGLSADDWPDGPTPKAAATILRRDFGRPMAAGTRDVTSDGTVRARVSALVTHLIGGA